MLKKAEMEMKKEDEKGEWKVEDEFNDADEPDDDSDDIHGSVKGNIPSQNPAADITAYYLPWLGLWCSEGGPGRAEAKGLMNEDPAWLEEKDLEEHGCCRLTVGAGRAEDRGTDNAKALAHPAQDIEMMLGLQVPILGRG